MGLNLEAVVLLQSDFQSKADNDKFSHLRFTAFRPYQWWFPLVDCIVYYISHDTWASGEISNGLLEFYVSKLIKIYVLCTAVSNVPVICGVKLYWKKVTYYGTNVSVKRPVYLWLIASNLSAGYAFLYIRG